MSEMDDKIIELYDGGLTYKEVSLKTGASNARISKLVKGHRSQSDAGRLTVSKGICKVANMTSEQCSANAIKSAISSRKFWTKPERMFRILLNECGVGVKFPPGMHEIIKQSDDVNADIFYQYPIQRYLCDFVDLTHKTIFRINGDYWHANPLLYPNQDDLTKPQKHNRIQDRNAKIYFEKHGWIIIDIWESEIAWDQDKVKHIIRAAREAANPTGLHPVDPRFESGAAQWQDRLKKLWFRQPKTKTRTNFGHGMCKCGKQFEFQNQREAARKKYCSVVCSAFYKRKTKWPSNLAELVAQSSMRAIGILLGVTDKAVKKHLKTKA